MEKGHTAKTVKSYPTKSVQEGLKVPWSRENELVVVVEDFRGLLVSLLVDAKYF